MGKLLAAISYHGFGHLAQTAVVLRQVRQLLPDLQISIASAAPLSILQHMLDPPFEHIPLAVDIGMVMQDALRVDVAASHSAYQQYHARWQHHLDTAVQIINAQRPDLVLSNISYTFIAAAAQCRVPAVALCSLNWHDIYARYCGDLPAAPLLQAAMREHYAAAQLFLQPEPSMPMPWLANTRPIGPLARLGHAHAARLRQRLAIPAEHTMVLLALGGVPAQLDLARWPELPHISVITEPDLVADPARFRDWRQAGMPFVDILASVDAVITKTGYGTFTEAACNGRSVLHVARPDWPEEPYLVPWLQRHAKYSQITGQQLQAGNLSDTVAQLLARPAVHAPAATGGDEAARIIIDFL